VTESCDINEAEFYQQQISVLRWAVELGSLDITGEVSMLAAYTAAPHVGHLKAVLHIFPTLISMIDQNWYYMIAMCGLFL
jgi:hypothetical protein